MNESIRIHAVIGNVAKKSRALVQSRLIASGFSVEQSGQALIATTFSASRAQAESAIRAAAEGAILSMQGYGVQVRMIGNGL